MRIFAFKDEETNQIWAIATKMWSENQEVFNTQMKGAKQQALVTVVYEDGGELNKVIMGDKYIQIAGANALNPKVGAKNWNDCYVVEGDRVFPKDVVEGKKDLTLNEAIEGVFLEGKLEDLVKNKYIKGLPKNVVENIDSEECRKELEESLKHYTEIKIKFIRTINQYTEKEREMFWKKFYERKLNILLNILYYNYTQNNLTIYKNPFFEIPKEEVKKYREMICIELSKMNIDKIASKNTLLKQYEDLKDKIKSKKEEFIYNQEFWKLFMNFYSIYSD